MTWIDILKNRRNIKIPKRKKGGEIDTSRFYSKPAIRDDSEIKREQNQLRLQASMTNTYKTVMERVIAAPSDGMDDTYREIWNEYTKFNREENRIADLYYPRDDEKNRRERIETLEETNHEQYLDDLEEAREKFEETISPLVEKYLKLSRNFRDSIGLKGGNLTDEAHIKKLKTTIYNEFNSYYDNKPMRMSQEEYETLKPLVSKVKLSSEQNAKIKSDLMNMKNMIINQLKSLVPLFSTRQARRGIKLELSLYNSKNVKKGDSTNNEWQTVLKKRPVTKIILSRKIVDSGMPIHLAREVINSLTTEEVKKYGRMIEVMEDRTIKKAIDMYLKKRQEADRKMSSIEGTTFARDEYFTTTPENTRAYSRYFLHLLETL